jgi:hypothetical protein
MEGAMESQVGWGTASIFIALAAAHAAEETVAEYRFSDAQGFRSAVARWKSLAADRIGLLLLLLALTLAGVLVDQFWIWLALGIVTADLMQHAASGIAARAYTPGAATAALLAVYVLAFVSGSVSAGLGGEPSSWGAMVIGMAFVAIGYLSAQRKRSLPSDRAVGKP